MNQMHSDIRSNGILVNWFPLIFRVAVVTITIICWTFVISWLPFVIRVILASATDAVPAWLYVVQIEMLGLNVTLNPVIYTVTNRRFRDFLLKTIFRRRTKPQHYLNRSFSGNRELNQIHRMSAFSNSTSSPNMKRNFDAMDNIDTRM